MGREPVVIVEERPGATAALGLWLRLGSAHEPPQLAGATHLLEHLMLRRTRTRSPEAIAELIDSLGGEVDAFTTQESCALTARVPAERFDEALDLLVEAMFRPRLLSEDVETERRVVAAEFDMVQDSPAEVVAEQALQACWNGHPLARPVLGVKETVQGLGVTVLRRFHRQRFGAHRLLLVAVGPVDERRIAAAIATLPITDRQVADVAPPAWSPGLVMEQRSGLEQVYVNLVLPGLPSGHGEAFTLGVLHQLLGAGNSSRLFRELREKRGLAYDIESSVFSTSAAGVLEVTFSAPLRNLRLCWDAVVDVLQEVANGRIHAGEVELARAALQAGLVLGSEGNDAIMDAHAGEFLSRGRRFDAARLIAELNAVSLARVRELARRLVRLDQIAGALCGPADDIPLPGWLPRRAA
jgi:predicted Zn-dependent peptidase